MRNPLAYLTVWRPQQEQSIVGSACQHCAIWGPAHGSYCLLMARKEELLEYPWHMRRLCDGGYFGNGESMPPRCKSRRYPRKESTGGTTCKNTCNKKGSSAHNLMHRSYR